MWRDKYLRGGTVSLMRKRKQDTKNVSTSKTSELDEFGAQIQALQLEIDILKEMPDVLKKDPGTDWKTLKNREKAVRIGAMKNDLPLPLLLRRFERSKSSYYYQVNTINLPDKYADLREKAKGAFEENRSCFGYRRIHGVIKNDGTVVSEKIIRWLMREEGLSVKTKGRKYNSYKGEITSAVPNLANRDFRSKEPGYSISQSLPFLPERFLCHRSSTALTDTFRPGRLDFIRMQTWEIRC